MIPSEFVITDGEITLNPGRRMVSVTVANGVHCPIQVSVALPFFEANPALRFDRARTACGSIFWPARPGRHDPAGTTLLGQPGERGGALRAWADAGGDPRHLGRQTVGVWI